MRGEHSETCDAGKMPDRSAEAGKEKGAGEASSHHTCACTHIRSLQRTIKIEREKKKVLVSVATRPLGASARESYWGEKKGICLLRSLMNWEIIIQRSTTTKDKQIHSRKYFKEHRLSQIPGKQRVGVRGSKQGEKATGMNGGEHPGGWAFMRDRLEPAPMEVINDLMWDKGLTYLYLIIKC